MKHRLKIYRTLPRYDSDAPSAVTIGNFDGVHIGHQAILRRVRQQATRRGLAATVMTFDPHPRAYFAANAQRPELVPTQISSLRDKLAALAQHEVDQVVLERFDETLADMSAENFIERLLVQGLNTRWLLVGDDFRYGHKRSGDVALLRSAGKKHGFEVQTITDIVDDSDQRVSSSQLRVALATGELQRATHLLGRSYCISGHVVHGQKLGRTIGYPTLNVRVPPQCAARSGVYVVKVHGLADQPLPAVASLGVRPTVSHRGRLLLEVHVLDGQLDAYGKLACVEFLQFLRDEEKFPDLPTMIAAIDNDVQGARDYFAAHGL